MKRNLLTQIKNEWRDNLWLTIELMIVSVAVWYLAISLINTLRPKFEPKGFDTDEVYRIQVRTLSTESPEYVDLGKKENKAALASDLRTIMKRIRRSENVEAAAFSNNALPYQYSYMGNILKIIGSEDSVFYGGNVRIGSPEIIRIIRPQSVDNVSLERMEQQLHEGAMYIAMDNYYSEQRNIRDLIGKKALLFDTVTPRNISGLIYPIRRSEYESGTGTILMGFDENDDKKLRRYSSEIAVRVKPGRGTKFEEEFYADKDMRRLRNVYLTQLESMEDVRNSTQYSKDTEVRLVCAGIIFLLVIIFLGLLGTFWFRIRQRVGEIALRKTCGATSRNIFLRTVSEGLLLLLIATIPALIIDYELYAKVIDTEGLRQYSYPLIALAITTALMAIMIIAGIMFPARKAMDVEPALALKEE